MFPRLKSSWLTRLAPAIVSRLPCWLGSLRSALHRHPHSRSYRPSNSERWGTFVRTRPPSPAGTVALSFPIGKHFPSRLSAHRIAMRVHRLVHVVSQAIGMGQHQPVRRVLIDHEPRLWDQAGETTAGYIQWRRGILRSVDY